MSGLNRRLKKIFWKLPLPGAFKEKLRIRYAEKKFARESRQGKAFECVDNAETLKEYSKYVLSTPSKKYSGVKEYEMHKSCKASAILIAYYLTQYSPDRHNDEWWGKGTTEWNNVSRAVPQFAGHRQPRLPGELGFYDLRIKEVMARQIEIAKNYGVDVFSFYYYWFADERILEGPLNMFLKDKSLDMPYMFCWVNENWTRRFSGTDEGILIGMDNTVENYKKYIHEVMPYFADERYFKINGRFVLMVYRPALMPQISEVLSYWRDEVRKEYNSNLYLIAVQDNSGKDWCKSGFDAENEWMQGSIKNQCRDITGQIKPIRKDFAGSVMDYADMVKNRKYIIPANRGRKVYPAVMPSWDNSARRNNKGVIWHGSTPKLYKTWLKDIICEVRERKELDAPVVFINAWNEWGEGTYLEPDRDYGYAYLQATWEAKNEMEQEVSQ